MKVKAFYPVSGAAFVVAGEILHTPPDGVTEYIDNGVRENLVTEIDIDQDHAFENKYAVYIRYASGHCVQRLLAPGDGWLFEPEPSSETPRLEPDEHS